MIGTQYVNCPHCGKTMLVKFEAKTTVKINQAEKSLVDLK